VGVKNARFLFSHLAGGLLAQPLNFLLRGLDGQQ
jgi:hypothetical protein